MLYSTERLQIEAVSDVEVEKLVKDADHFDTRQTARVSLN